MPDSDYYIRKLEGSDTVQNLKVGNESFLPLDYAIAVIRDKIAENVSCRFVVTDVKSEVVSFYEKQEFVLLDSEGNQSTEYQLMFLDLVALA